jgi:hypothetical protein
MRNTIKKGSGGQGGKGSRERHLNPGIPGQDPWSRPTVQQGRLRFSRAGLESSNPDINKADSQRNEVLIVAE